MCGGEETCTTVFMLAVLKSFEAVRVLMRRVLSCLLACLQAASQPCSLRLFGWPLRGTRSCCRTGHAQASFSETVRRTKA